jgi:lipopolysaccharide/colanic/teichoic acid biosynthesis glycosyltransferase
MSLYKSVIKRTFDILFSLLILVLLSPVLLALILVLYISNNGRIFFFQDRPGRNAKLFRVIKFKTMTDEKDASGKYLPDELRLTRMGKFIRANSLDELPQLINVFKGDMSFVGPRPLLPKYLPLYSKVQARRHEVRPGITGWAQINGRNDISWKEKFELDIYYVDNLSFMLDFKIILLTIVRVLKKEGVSKDGFATTEAFNGDN